MKFKELLSKYEWDDIGPVLVRLYQDQEKNLAGYRQVFETLRTIQPVETKMRLAIEDVLDEFAGEYYASVSGKDGTLMKDLIPPVSVDEEAGNREVSYGIELTDWAEWLDMEIEPETLSRYTEVDIIGHCLWEMTFFGYSQEDIKKTVEELERARESDERLTPEDFEEELGLQIGSALREAPHPPADLDVAVLPDLATYDWLCAYTDLYDDLCPLFQADNVDVLMLNEVPLPFRFTVVWDGLLVWVPAEQEALAFAQAAVAAYNDIAPWRREHWACLCRRIEEGLQLE